MLTEIISRHWNSELFVIMSLYFPDFSPMSKCYFSFKKILYWYSSESITSKEAEAVYLGNRS